jgi:hypothetical protein
MTIFGQVFGKIALPSGSSRNVFYILLSSNLDVVVFSRKFVKDSHV